MPTAKQKILIALRKLHPGEAHTNEIIRETGLFPRSVSLALEGLLSDGRISDRRVGNLRLFKYAKGEVSPEPKEAEEKGVSWEKVLTRKTWLVFQVELSRGCSKYFGEVLSAKGGKNLYRYNWYNSLTGSVYGVMSEFQAHGAIASEKIKDSPGFSAHVLKDCLDSMDSLVSFASRGTQLARRYSPAGASKFISVFREKYQKLMPHIVLGTSMEFGLLSKIRTWLSGRSDAEELLNRLSSPVYTCLEENTAALRLAAKLNERIDYADARRLIEGYAEKFSFLSVQSPEDAPFSLEDMEASIESLRKGEPGPLDRLTKLEAEEAENKKRLDEALDGLSATKEQREVVWLLQEYTRLRTQRMNVLYKVHALIRPFLLRIGSELGLAGGDVFLLTLDELEECVSKAKVSKEIAVELARRKNGWAVLLFGGRMRVFSGADNVVAAMESFGIKRKLSGQKRKTELVGRRASAGKAVGVARVINSVTELGSFKQGEILVTHMTTPDYVVAMSKAIAFVTDEGGVTCHAAIVAREMNVPCVVGTQEATRMIKTGQVIEVDATSGLVRILEDSEAAPSLGDLRGRGMNKGVARGEVVLLDSPAKRVEPGFIAVMREAEPAFLNQIYRAAALVVEDSSATSHAVLYLTALGIPGIIGLKGATLALRDGQRVVVDAGTGTVKPI